MTMSGPAGVAPKDRRRRRYPRPSICLDHLSGLCEGKRQECKFLHPDLAQLHASLAAAATDDPDPIVPSAAAATPEAAVPPICEVWALTGACKFGAKCSKGHPLHLRREAPARKPRRRPNPAHPRDPEAEFELFFGSLLAHGPS